MIISPGLVTAAKQKGQKKLASSGTPGELFSQVDAVVDLLAGATSPAAQRGTRVLFQQMATSPWYVIRGAHRSADDPTLHVTVEVGGARYHLRLDGRNCVFDITNYSAGQTQRAAGQKPFVSPGS